MNPRRISLLFAAAVLLAAAAARAQNPQPAPRQQAASASAQPASQPIPDISTLMQQLIENQDRVDKLREDYACRDARIVQKLDKHGRVEKTTTYVYQVSFFDGHQIQRLIEKNGQPLSAKAQKKEDNRIRKEIEKYARDRKSGKQARQRKKAEVGIQDFLKADRFYHPRREQLDGRSVIAFDFEANPEFKAKSRAEKVAQSLAGTIWIDATAHEVVRLDARFAKSYKVGWGLVASVHRGTAIAIRQTLVHNQVWLPTYVQARVSARALFFHVRQAETDRYTNYRRFHVRSTSHPFPPEQP
jgi:hypothetical protein